MKDDRLFSLDRIEGEIAVLVDDDGVIVHEPLSSLPGQVCEGNLYRKNEAGYREDLDELQARRQKVRALQDRLRGRK